MNMFTFDECIQSDAYIKEAMKESSVDYNKSDSDEITAAWDQLHKSVVIII